MEWFITTFLVVVLKKEVFQFFLSEVSAIYSEENRVDFVVDNCRSTILENHRIVYLPPYSPFLNAIEEAFSFIKNQVKNDLQENMSSIVCTNNTGKIAILENIVISAVQGVPSDSWESWIQHCITYYPNCILKEHGIY